MLIALLTDPIQVADYTYLFPNVSFPADGPDAEWLAENNCMPVNVWKEHDSTQKLIPAEPYVEGEWVYTVQVVSKTDDDLAAEKESKAAEVRQQRNRLLAESDWTQLADAPVDKAIWAVKRQALRDISSQDGFPFDVVWPE